MSIQDKLLTLQNIINFVVKIVTLVDKVVDFLIDQVKEA